MRYRRTKIIQASIWAGLIFFITSASHAALDNKGSDFILSFLPQPSTENIELHLTSDVATDVTIQYPVNTPTFNTTVAVAPGTITTVPIPNTASSSWVVNSVSNNSVRAFANEEFVAYLINRAAFTSDAALGLPVDTFNTEYIVATYNAAFGGGEFIVYAGFDNTTVTITPNNTLNGRPAGVPFDIILNRGEGYHGRSLISSGSAGSLTGTLVSADRPVGLVNGNYCTQVPLGTTACDHIFEVAQPVQSWGESGLVSNLPNRPNGSIYRILASEDNTTITQDGVPIGTINRGAFIETAPLPGNHVFAGDKPIYVIQFMTGLDSPGATLGDPAMGNMMPSAQYLSEYTFSTVGGGQFAEHYLTIIAENTDLATILLDGGMIGAASFTPIAGTNFSATTLPISDGTHTTSSSDVHGITVSGYNSYDSYIYPGGALFEFINPAGDANAPICTSTLLTGPPPSLQGSAQDNRPSEDLNGDGVLDVAEDLNSNGQIDEDTGIFFVELEPGATNLDLVVTPFTPGDGTSSFNVSLLDSSLAGTGIVKVTDGAGNSCTIDIDLDGPIPPTVCDIDTDGDVDRDDINLIVAARNTPASGIDDLRDIDGNGFINVLDARQCTQLCTYNRCAVSP